MAKNYFLLAFLFFLFICFSHVKAEKGAPYLVNIEYGNAMHNKVWSMERAHNGSIMLAGRNGLTCFDGESWTVLTTPDIALEILASEYDEAIYVCGRNYFGYLKENRKAEYEYYPLTNDLLNQGLFTQIIENESSIVFISAEGVVIIDRKSLEPVSAWGVEEEAFYLGGFSYKDTLYISNSMEGMLKAAGEELVQVGALSGLISKQIVFSSPAGDSVLLGTEDGDIYSYNGRVLTRLEFDDIDYIRKGILSDGIKVSGSLLALATSNLGVILVDQSTGVTKQIIDQSAGLPSDQAMCMLSKQGEGLWIAHPYGLSRIDLDLPLRNFTPYSGIRSGILTLVNWNNTVYVGASDGVYVLDTLKHYQTHDITKRIPVSVTESPVPAKEVKSKSEEDAGLSEQEESITKEIEGEEKKEKRGFFKRIFGGDEAEDKADKKEKTVKKESDAEKKSVTPPVLSQKFETISYQQLEIKSGGYGFSALNGIDEKCKFLYPIEDELLALTDSRLYSISDENNVKEIFASTHIYELKSSILVKDKIYLVAMEGIFQASKINDTWEVSEVLAPEEGNRISALSEWEGNKLILAVNDQLAVYDLVSDSMVFHAIENPYSETIGLVQAGDEVFATIGNNLFRVYTDGQTHIGITKVEDISYIYPFSMHGGNLWTRDQNQALRIYGRTKVSERLLSFLRILDKPTELIFDEEKNLWIVDNYNKIYRLNIDEFENYQSKVDVLISRIITAKGLEGSSENIDLKYNNNSLTFQLGSSMIFGANSNEYQYRITGLMEDWSDWSADNIIALPYLPPGHFTLEVRARNILGTESEIKSLDFRIRPPIWRTVYFYLVIALLLFAAAYFVQQYRLRKHIREKKILQDKVRERTVELEDKNKSITDSIHYARRIQKAMLPTLDTLNACLNDYFVFYRPRNIVSGDFYWASQKGDKIVIAAADCTGHGVPGAFLSMLGMAYLNEIMRKSANTITAAQVLSKLRERIIKLLQQQNGQTREGMDIGILIMDMKSKKAQFAGAHNPLIHLQSKEGKSTVSLEPEAENEKFRLYQYKGNRFQVGISRQLDKDFTNHEIEFNTGDLFYLFSDGFPDQFGGDEEVKYKYKPFRRLILENALRPMSEQHDLFEKTIVDWMGNYEQTDDMLIFGIKV